MVTDFLIITVYIRELERSWANLLLFWEWSKRARVLVVSGDGERCEGDTRSQAEPSWGEHVFLIYLIKVIFIFSIKAYIYGNWLL